MNESTPLSSDRLRQIARSIPEDLWGDPEELLPEEIAWIRSTPAVMRALIAHVRFVESEADHFADVAETLSRRVGDAAKLVYAMHQLHQGHSVIAPTPVVALRVLVPDPDDLPESIRTYAPTGHGELVRERTGLKRTLLTRLTDGRVMCALCFEYVERADLNVVDGVREDVCLTCAALEAASLAREGRLEGLDAKTIKWLHGKEFALRASSIARWALARDQAHQLGAGDDETRELMRDPEFVESLEQMRRGERVVARTWREEEAARAIEEYYGGEPAPLPDGVVPVDEQDVKAADDGEC